MLETKNNQIQISIIIAVHNAANSLKYTLDSLLFQDYKNFEVLIVDNNSIDETSDIVVNYSGIITKYIREEDTGIYDAWNKAILYASGDWVSFLGAGDYLFNNSLVKLVQLIEANPNSNFISGRVKFTGANAKSLVVGSKFCPKTINYYQNVAHIGSLTSRKLIIENGFFSTKYKISGDYDFFLRVKDNLNPIFLNEVICVGSYGISQMNSLVFIENFRIWESLNVHNFFYRYILLIKRIMVFYLKVGYENFN